MTATIVPRCPLCGLENTSALPAFCARPGCGVELLPGTPERLKPRTFQLTSHYSLCVLPFTFADADGHPLPERLVRGNRWKERVFSLNNADDVDRTEYFLPYIRRFLFPSLFAQQAGTGGRVEHKPSCWHFTFDLGRLGASTAKGLPLTLRAQDGRKRMSVEHALLLESVELIAFGYRVAFLVLRFQGTDPGVTYFDQMEALAYLRTIAPLYRDFAMPELVASGTTYRMETLLPYLLAEFAPGPVPATPAANASLPVKPTYDDRMMIYTFSCVDKDTALPNYRQCRSLLEKHAIVSLDAKGSSRAHGELETDPTAWLRARWQAFTKDGGMLVVFNTDRYHAHYMGIYHSTYYFDIFLLAALQRVTLLALFDRFSNIQELITGSSGSRKLLRDVRRDLLLFKNQCWFSQITNRERGLLLWKKWQKVFETRTLLREVNEQSEELNTYLQARYRERIEWLVRIYSFLAAALPILFGLESFLGQKDWVASLRWGLLAALVVGAVLVAYLVVFRQREGE